MHKEMMDGTTPMVSIANTIISFIDFGFHVVELFSDTDNVAAKNGLSSADDEPPLLHDLETFEDSLLKSLHTSIGCLNQFDTHVESLRHACSILAANLRLRLERDANERADGSVSDDITKQLWAEKTTAGIRKCLENLRIDIEENVVPHLQTIAADASSNKAKVNQKLILTDRSIRAPSNSSSPSHEDHVQDTASFGAPESASRPMRASIFSSDPKVLAARALRGPQKRPTVNPEVLQDFILEELSFSSMKDREEEVSAAHQKTFDWIFRSHTEGGDDKSKFSTFSRWLTGNDLGGVYWINGKAGSGKSTLMRYITDHVTTRQLLESWAGDYELTTAGYYFWTSGSLEQRSQTGLLRYLLFQLLDQHRDTIPRVFPDLWKKLLGASTQERIKLKLSWNIEQLTTGLKTFLKYSATATKVCLFIDGLDEFDGDHPSIIELFSNMAKDSAGNVKFCLSSRPWPVFEAAFSSGPTLKLQDLTANDMKQFVEDKLGKDPRVRRMIRKEPEVGSKLLVDVVSRADGVFLWIILVVKSLLSSLKTGDTISNLQARLLDLPTDLDNLFQYTLFDTQDKTRIEDASKIFQLIRAREIVCEFINNSSSNSLTLWDLALTNEAMIQLLSTPITQIDPEEVATLCQSTQDIITNSCANLLTTHIKSHSQQTNGLRFADPSTEALSQTSAKLTFAHRTIRDWLLLPATWNSILLSTLGTKPPFNPHAQHLQSTILSYRLPLEPLSPHRRLPEWWDDITLSLTHARYAYTSSTTPPSKTNHLIETLDQTISSYWLSRNGDHWARSSFGTYEEREQRRSPISSPFLCLCVKLGLTPYISSILTSPPHKKQWRDSYEGGATLLSYALEMLISRRQSLFPLSDPAMIRLLLKEGELDANERYLTFKGVEETPWMKTLGLLREGERRGWIDWSSAGSKGWGQMLEEDGIKRWVEILRILIAGEQGNADLGLVIEETKWDPQISAVGVFELLDASCCDFRVKELLELVKKGREILVVRDKGKGKEE